MEFIIELVVEIILWGVVAPIIEVSATAIGTFIVKRWKWNPLKKVYDKQAAEATDTRFIMMSNPEIKGVQIFALVCAVLGFILSIVVLSIIYALKNMSLIDFILAELICQAIVFPLLLCALHYTTKKIYFFENEIVIKSVIYFKRVNFNQITSVIESDHTRTSLMLVIRYNKRRKLKINSNFVNYELAKKRFVDMQLIN